MAQNAETNRRIKQMVAFIRQEAKDKAEEIQVRANEECNVEVLKMVDREKSKLREYYKQQEKRIEIEQKIERQKLLDEFRMNLLKLRETKKKELEAQAQAKFKDIVNDKASYKQFLLDALMQAMIKIWDEREVIVSCRKEDGALVKQILPEALKAVKAKAKKETDEDLEMKATFDSTPFKCCGGVRVTARGGRVICDNTLDARLKISMYNLLPFVRDELFNQGTLQNKA